MEIGCVDYSVWTKVIERDRELAELVEELIGDFREALFVSCRICRAGAYERVVLDVGGDKRLCGRLDGVGRNFGFD